MISADMLCCLGLFEDSIGKSWMEARENKMKCNDQPEHYEEVSNEVIKPIVFMLWINITIVYFLGFTYNACYSFHHGFGFAFGYGIHHGYMDCAFAMVLAKTLVMAINVELYLY